MRGYRGGSWIEFLSWQQPHPLSTGVILTLETPEELDSLVPLARSGDPGARSDLFDAVLPRLQQFLIPKLGAKLQRHTDLDDICQDVFLRGFKAIHSLDPDADYRQFVGLILQHAKWQVLDAGRSNSRFSGESNVPGGVMTIPADGDQNNGEVLLFMREKVDGLHRLISKLPDDLAQVVWLRLDGLPDAKIGNLLSITPELVRKRHQRAIEKLRQFAS